ncbi:uncharacterized protein LOC111693462 [Trichogramma pretiosum]|uniref:uncharacterized protein LOC111693462 n=1 Tax=Trichogramma pretiosum TaxID=7493 RepID=UPI000C71B843|nr:uncharacterized protein LOC111693462 [Trichogramma pretiosum]
MAKLLGIWFIIFVGFHQSMSTKSDRYYTKRSVANETFLAFDDGSLENSSTWYGLCGFDENLDSFCNIYHEELRLDSSKSPEKYCRIYLDQGNEKINQSHADIHSVRVKSLADKGAIISWASLRVEPSHLQKTLVVSVINGSNDTNCQTITTKIPLTEHRLVSYDIISLEDNFEVIVASSMGFGQDPDLTSFLVDNQGRVLSNKTLPLELWNLHSSFQVATVPSGSNQHDYLLLQYYVTSNDEYNSGKATLTLGESLRNLFKIRSISRGISQTEHYSGYERSHRIMAYSTGHNKISVCGQQFENIRCNQYDPETKEITRVLDEKFEYQVHEFAVYNTLDGGILLLTTECPDAACKETGSSGQKYHVAHHPKASLDHATTNLSFLKYSCNLEESKSFLKMFENKEGEYCFANACYYDSLKAHLIDKMQFEISTVCFKL